MREDYQAFKEDAVRELRAHWLTNRTTVKEAIIDLYQPNAADHAASKTFLTHVDSMAQLKLAAFQINSSEDLTTLQTAPFVELGTPAGTQLLAAGNSASANKAVLCDSSESSDNASNDAETWTSTSPSTPADGTTQSMQTSLAPLELTNSDKSLLGQVTAPHINVVTPMRRGSFRKEDDTASTASQECKASSLTTPPDTAEGGPGPTTKPIITPAPLLVTDMMPIPMPLRISDAAAKSSLETITTTALVSCSDPNNHNNNNNNNINKLSEGLRIILREDSPASSLSSFETPLLIYGQ